MKKMTEKTMRQADGGYFRRGVQAYIGGKWVTVYDKSTLFSENSWFGLQIKNGANQTFNQYYYRQGILCRYF